MTSDQEDYIASARSAYMEYLQKVINRRKLGNSFEKRFDTVKVIYLKKCISILYDYFNAEAGDDNFFEASKAETLMQHIADITGKHYYLKLT